MNINQLREVTYNAAGLAIDPAHADDALRVAHAIERNTIDRIHKGAAVHALVAEWRDSNQFKKGDTIAVSRLVALVASVMDVVGWYEPPTIRVVNDPQPHEPRR